MLHVFLAIGGLGAIGRGLSLLLDPDGDGDRGRGPSSLHFWTLAGMAFGLAGTFASALRWSDELVVGTSGAVALAIALLFSRASTTEGSDGAESRS